MLDFIPRPDIRGWIRSGGKITFRGASIALFVVVFGVLAVATATSGSVLVVVFGTFILFYMLRGALPADKIDQWTNDLMTGEAGERAWEWLLAVSRRLRWRR